VVVSHTRTTIVCLVVGFLPPLLGCEDQVREEWQRAHKSSYESSYQSQIEDGRLQSSEERKAYQAGYKEAYPGHFKESRASGIEEGAKKGAAKAREAAEAGSAWQFYSTSAWVSLVFGILIGVFAQYAILVTCRLSQQLPPVMAFALIPAMNKSLSYSVFERRCRLMLELDEELNKVQATRNLHMAQIQAVHDAVRRQIAAASSVEELTHARLVELANKEFAKIVAAAEAANHVRARQQPVVSAVRNTCTCPHCGNRITFKDQAANKTVKCPYQKCGQPFRLPSLTSDSNDMPPIAKR